MELAKIYTPNDVEDKWYKYWLKKKYFRSTPDERTPYTIVIPPPNVTGVLHMGHMLNNTIQDVLIRRARQQGKNACWVPGTDHASIATEAKVVKMLADQGIDKSTLSRADFLEHAWEWKNKYGGIILEQLKKLGCSCDWERTKFTMDEDLSKSVIKVFVDLYRKGLIYRGTKMVNWDCKGKTTLSDEEVIHKEVQSNLYYIQYKLVGSEGHVTIATTRPETIMADTAVCVHPDDTRYQHLIGKKVQIPLLGKEIPIIADTYIDIEFGTGCLKVTPAHDINDYELGIKHGLEIIDILNEDGTLNKNAILYVGKDRFAARKEVVHDIEAIGQLEKVEQIKNAVGHSERTDAVVEPRISTQWFVNMKQFLDKNPEVVSSVMDDVITFLPPKLKNTYRHWMENIRDWNISRQLWWGHQIPAWFTPDGTMYVATSLEEAWQASLADGKQLRKDELIQDPDVLDTWFSSWLWPISVFDGINHPNNADIKYYYPTNVLVTAPEIIFFWVARMIMAGYEYQHVKPFSHVYFTGIVRDKQRRKMSKQLGNSPDPLELIDKYGADGVRIGMLMCSPAGNDILYDDSLVEQGRNFTNKIWNALRLIKSWETQPGDNDHLNGVFAWMDAKFNKTVAEIEHLFEEFKLSEALMVIYNFIWDDFCSWYLEMVKPVYGGKIHIGTLDKTVQFFERLMRLLHPFAPFITEEIYHLLKERSVGDDVCIAPYPSVKAFNSLDIEYGELIKQAITVVRDVRNKAQLPQKHPVKVFIETDNKTPYWDFEQVLCKLAYIEDFEFTKIEIDGAVTELIGTDKAYILTGVEMDVAAEKKKLQDEIAYYEGFIHSVETKLSNDRFVQNAKPEVVEKERQKLADGRAKLNNMKEALAKL
ncbi:MAG: valine--tRNA ligase [Chitinophagales bacterium]|nr:valine--tRNA ligase [Chitinophagales bacterium]